MDNNFTESAKGLSRNPLGIIALFLSLIYVLACLVLGVTASNLNLYEKIPLIYFLIVFPFCILGSFMYLVTKHHTKLYAPLDFRNDNNFVNMAQNKGFENVSISGLANDSRTEGNPIGKLIKHSSAIGLWSLMIVKLSIKHLKGVSLEDINAIHEELNGSYFQGYIVACVSIGAFEVASQDPKYSFANLAPELENGIEEEFASRISENFYGDHTEMVAEITNAIKKHFES
jgi:hypothetical protein